MQRGLMIRSAPGVVGGAKSASCRQFPMGGGGGALEGSLGRGVPPLAFKKPDPVIKTKIVHLATLFKTRHRILYPSFVSFYD